MYPFFTQSANVSAPYVQVASWKSGLPLYSSYLSTQERSALERASW
jgi:hypothetical protein